MTPSVPLLSSSSTILWLKVFITAVSLVLLYVRHKRKGTAGVARAAYPLRAKVLLVLAVAFSFGVFHSFGSPKRGQFVHYGEMFHYYLGAKYFKELGHFELYNAVIVADSEQDSALANLPFYTDLTTYQNIPREAALQKAGLVKGLFSTERWSSFRRDVSFFKKATNAPRSRLFSFYLMDHGYNASPVSTTVLGALTNIIPVTQLGLLASLDLLLVAAMIVLVFRTFSFEMGALFSAYFFVNILNDPGYVSGGLLRYDWLFCIVAAVCLLEKGRHASSSFFLTLAAMMKIFPVVLFYGMAVSIVRRVKASRALDKKSNRFVLAAVATALALFSLSAVYLGSPLQPWKEFAIKTALHDDGVYVNHVGLRGIALFEPSHLSLEEFVAAYQSSDTPDLVRHWQDVKEREFQQKKPAILFCSLLVLVCLTVILWRRRESDSESVIWPLLLIYAMSFPSHYYYAFLCLFVLLFFRHVESLSGFVPLCLLLLFNIVALVTDSFGPSPIAFYTLVNLYLFVCLASILGFALYANVLRKSAEEGSGPDGSVPESVTVPATKSAQSKRGRGKRN